MVRPISKECQVSFRKTAFDQQAVSPEAEWRSPSAEVKELKRLGGLTGVTWWTVGDLKKEYGVVPPTVLESPDVVKDEKV